MVCGQEATSLQCDRETLGVQLGMGTNNKGVLGVSLALPQPHTTIEDSQNDF